MWAYLGSNENGADTPSAASHDDSVGSENDPAGLIRVLVQFSEVLQITMIAAIRAITVIAQVSTGVRSAFRSAHPVRMARETSFLSDE